MRLQPPAETEEEPGQFWKDFIRDTGAGVPQADDRAARGLHPADLAGAGRRLEVRGRPPARDLRRAAPGRDRARTTSSGSRRSSAADCPWVRIVSCNPLELPDPDLPPVFSGYPTGDSAGWDEFRAEYRRVHGDMHADFDEFMRERGCPPLPELEFIHRSPYLNLFLYPEEADYERSRPLGPMWERLDSCVRKEGLGDFEVPEGDGALVYLSLGSLGSADVELMQRLVDLLAAGGYRAIVSKGPQHDQIELRDGQVGRGAGAAAGAPAAGGRGDHARRQQHRHRVPPLREADGAAAAVLGPVRQRPARWTSWASACGCRPSSSRTRSSARRSTADRRRGARRPAHRRSRRGSRPIRARSEPRTASRASAAPSRAPATGPEPGPDAASAPAMKASASRAAASMPSSRRVGVASWSA